MAETSLTERLAEKARSGRAARFATLAIVAVHTGVGAGLVAWVFLQDGGPDRVGVAHGFAFLAYAALWVVLVECVRRKVGPRLRTSRAVCRCCAAELSGQSLQEAAATCGECPRCGVSLAGQDVA